MIARYAPGERERRLMKGERWLMRLVVVWPVRGALISRKYVGWTDGTPWGPNGYQWHDDKTGEPQSGLVVEEFDGAGDVEPMLVRYEDVALVATSYVEDTSPVDDEDGDTEFQDVGEWDDPPPEIEVPMLEEAMDDELIVKMMLASDALADNPIVQNLDQSAFTAIKWIGYIDILVYLHYAVLEREEVDLDKESWENTFRQFAGELLLIEAMYGKG